MHLESGLIDCVSVLLLIIDGQSGTVSTTLTCAQGIRTHGARGTIPMCQKISTL